MPLTHKPFAGLREFIQAGGDSDKAEDIRRRKKANRRVASEKRARDRGIKMLRNGDCPPVATQRASRVPGSGSGKVVSLNSNGTPVARDERGHFAALPAGISKASTLVGANGQPLVVIGGEVIDLAS